MTGYLRPVSIPGPTQWTCWRLGQSRSQVPHRHRIPEQLTRRISLLHSDINDGRRPWMRRSFSAHSPPVEGCPLSEHPGKDRTPKADGRAVVVEETTYAWDGRPCRPVRAAALGRRSRSGGQGDRRARNVHCHAKALRAGCCDGGIRRTGPGSGPREGESFNRPQRTGVMGGSSSQVTGVSPWSRSLGVGAAR